MLFCCCCIKTGDDKTYDLWISNAYKFNTNIYFVAIVKEFIRKTTLASVSPHVNVLLCKDNIAAKDKNAFFLNIN